MNKEELFYIQSNTTKIEAGKVLMSEPFLNSYYFERSTVLIIDHNENEGTLGIILNKKLPLGINDIIKDFPKFDGDVYLGGPVSSDSIFRSRMTSGTQSGIMPRSSAQVSMSVAAVTSGSLRRADSLQNSLCLL